MISKDNTSITREQKMTKNVNKAAIITLGNISRLVIKTIIGVILVRIFSKEIFGTYRQTIFLYQTFSALFFLGIPYSILYFIPKIKKNEESKSFVTHTLLFMFVLSLFFSLLLFLFRNVIAEWFNNQLLSKVLLIFCSYPIFMMISETYNYLLLGFQKPKKVAFFAIFSIISDFIFILSIALFTNNIQFTILGLVISSAIQFLYVIFDLRNFATLKLNFDKDIILKQIRFSLPIWFSGMITLLTKQIDKMIISTYFTPEIFAIFAIGSTEIPIIGTLRNSVFGVLHPEIMKLNFQKQKAEIIKLFSGSTRKMAIIIFPIITFFFFFAKDFLNILYTDNYNDSIIIFRIYLLITPLRIVNYSLLLQAASKTNFLLYRSILVLVLNTILNIILVKTIGIIGPALATVIVTYIDIILFISIFKYSLGFKLLELFHFKSIFFTFIIANISALLISPMLLLNMKNWIRFPLGFLSHLAVFYLLGSFFKIITQYDKEILRKGILKITNILKCNPIGDFLIRFI